MKSTLRGVSSGPKSFTCTALAAAAVLFACATQTEPVAPGVRAPSSPSVAEPAAPSAADAAKPVPPPLASLDGTAYATGMRVQLPKVAPTEAPGLHNVYRLGSAIVSGSEPHGEEAFKKMQEMGIRTIVSVDGKVPDAALAQKYGMTYVHVPIQYHGIADEEIMQLAKTFREKEAPFYVHCFHGMHRGPAAAEIGRIALDGIPRDQALAEMRQWCGTAQSYEGLYHTVAQAGIPAARETRAYAFDFPAAHPFAGFRHVMVDVSRNDDNLKSLAKRKWQPDPAHPDVVPQEEAAQLAKTFERCVQLEEVASRPADFKTWLAEAGKSAAALRDALGALKDGNGTSEAADREYKRLAAACNACHGVYRN